MHLILEDLLYIMHYSDVTWDCGRDTVTPLCLQHLNSLFKLTTEETWKPCIAGTFGGESTITSEFPQQVDCKILNKTCYSMALIQWYPAKRALPAMLTHGR